jgi:hypothetical protein
LFGACLTAILIILASSYLIYNVIKTVNRSEYKITYTSHYKNLITDKTDYNITYKDHDILLQLLYTGTNLTFQDELDTYFSFNIY